MSDIRILLAVSTSRYSRALVDLAMSEAEKLAASGTQQVAIDVLYILEGEDLLHISHRAGDQGFLGLSTTADVISTLGAEHHRMALLRIDEVKAAAATKGSPVSVMTSANKLAVSGVSREGLQTTQLPIMIAGATFQESK